VNYKNTLQNKKANEVIDELLKNNSIIKEYPKNIIKNDFCVFILSYGRAKNLTTLNTLNKGDFTKDYYIICSDDDKDLPIYIQKYKDRVLVFNKDIVSEYIDLGDNFNIKNIVIYARIMCFVFAKKMGYRYFVQLDDDYKEFMFRYIENDKLKHITTYDYDRMFDIHLNFLKNTPFTTIAMAQGGDMIGGSGNDNVIKGYKRKVMNSFFCDVNRVFLFYGSYNEDATFYGHNSIKGTLVITLYGYMLDQEPTQNKKGGLTEAYLEDGTYIKSFYSVMYSPSNIKIGQIGNKKNARIHHLIDGIKSYPLIINKKYSNNDIYNNINLEEW